MPLNGVANHGNSDVFLSSVRNLRQRAPRCAIGESHSPLLSLRCSWPAGSDFVGLLLGFATSEYITCGVLTRAEFSESRLMEYDARKALVRSKPDPAD